MRRRRDEPPPDPMDRALPLDQPKKLLKLYYAGRRLPSPQGGLLDTLRIRTEPDDSAVILFECNASSLRYVLEVPKATRSERAKVKKMISEGGDVHCPRHGPEVRLQRTGSGLMCPSCGIPFAKLKRRK